MLKSKDHYPQNFVLLHHQLKSTDKDKICLSKNIILLCSKFCTWYKNDCVENPNTFTKQVVTHVNCGGSWL